MCQTGNIPADQQAFPEFACIQDVASLQSGPQAGDQVNTVECHHPLQKPITTLS
jgi:hypothetical protein